MNFSGASLRLAAHINLLSWKKCPAGALVLDSTELMDDDIGTPFSSNSAIMGALDFFSNDYDRDRAQKWP